MIGEGADDDDRGGDEDDDVLKFGLKRHNIFHGSVENELIMDPPKRITM